jgi:hypothetical protein
MGFPARPSFTFAHVPNGLHHFVDFSGSYDIFTAFCGFAPSEIDP